MPQGDKRSREVRSLVASDSSLKNILNVALEKGGIKGGYMKCHEISDPLDPYRVFKAECYDGKKYIIKISANTNDEDGYIQDIERAAFEKGEYLDSIFDLVSEFETTIAKGFIFKSEATRDAGDFTSLTFKGSADEIGKAYKEIHSLSLPSEEPSSDYFDNDTPESVANAFSYILEATKTKNKTTCIFPSELDDIYITQGREGGINVKFFDFSACSKWNPLLDLAVASVLFKLDAKAVKLMCLGYGDESLAEKVDGMYELACLLMIVRQVVSKRDNPMVRDLGKVLEKTKKRKIKALYKEIKNDI